jgi:hypothetical protein
MTSLLKIAVIGTLTAATFVACSQSPKFKSVQSTRGEVRNGALMVARPVPHRALIAQHNSGVGSVDALGFAPSLLKGAPQEQGRAAIVVSKSRRTVELLRGTEVITSTPIDARSAESLTPGTFKVMLEQRDPVWYATTEYYTARNLTIPSEGNRERFLKGALGDYAIFLTKDTAIHTAAVRSPEVKGVIVDEATMSAIAAVVAPGTPVIIE